jgi:hypothetical protein
MDTNKLAAAIAEDADLVLACADWAAYRSASRTGRTVGLTRAERLEVYHTVTAAHRAGPYRLNTPAMVEAREAYRATGAVRLGHLSSAERAALVRDFGLDVGVVGLAA